MAWSRSWARTGMRGRRKIAGRCIPSTLATVRPLPMHQPGALRRRAERGASGNFSLGRGSFRSQETERLLEEMNPGRPVGVRVHLRIRHFDLIQLAFDEEDRVGIGCAFAVIDANF